MKTLVEQRTIQILLEGLEKHRDFSSFQGTAFYTLNLLVPLGTAAIDEIIKYDGVPVILNSMLHAQKRNKRRRKTSDKREDMIHHLDFVEDADRESAVGISLYRMEFDDPNHEDYSDGGGERTPRNESFIQADSDEEDMEEPQMNSAGKPGRKHHS
jgi:hypothetical protein